MIHGGQVPIGAVETLARFLDHIETSYGEGSLLGVSQGEFTEELLVYLWARGYKVVPMDQEDYHVH